MDVGRVKYGNNATGEIEGYDTIMNGEFTIKLFLAYVEGLQHNLISLSQLGVGSGLKVTFDEEGPKIKHKEFKKILLKSKRKGQQYPLDMKPTKRNPYICLLANASYDDSCLWPRRLSHLNFKDIHILVLSDLLQVLPLLFITYDLCRFTWVYFLRHKSKITYEMIKSITSTESEFEEKCSKDSK